MSARTGGRVDNGRTQLDETVDLALGASRALVGIVARSLASIDSDITLTQYRALVLISTRGEQNVGTLAKELGIHPSTATRLCDRLLVKRLIVRKPSPASRREVAIELSDSGRALVRTVMNRRRRDLRRIIGALEPSEQRRLVEAFRVFSEAAGEVRDDAWRLGWTP